MYYEAYINNNESWRMERTIMSFNVRFETFKPIKFPCCVDSFRTGGASSAELQWKISLGLLIRNKTMDS